MRESKLDFKEVYALIDDLHKGQNAVGDIKGVAHNKPAFTTAEEAVEYNVKAAAESSLGHLDGIVNFLKKLEGAYEYIESDNERIDYATYPRHPDVSEAQCRLYLFSSKIFTKFIPTLFTLSLSLSLSLSPLLRSIGH